FNVSQRLGHNYRMPEINAAIGYNQLMKISRFIEIRKKNADKLESLLETLGRLVLPVEPEQYSHVWYVYTARLRGSRAGERNKVVNKLVNSGIQASVYYNTPLHLSLFYRRKYGYRPGTLPKTETTARQVFSLPVHPAVSDDDLKFISLKLKKILE
ncbi:MAG: DegT/DnrJ/EryC1/StrS family aminotransferase, partial [Candidatus Bathyarchaeota archaeon]